MVFNVIISLRDLRTKGGKNYAIMISDTVKVTSQGAEVLTNEIAKKLQDITYNIEDENGADNGSANDDMDHEPAYKFKPEELKEGEIFTRSKRRGAQMKVEEEKLSKYMKSLP